MLRAGDLAGKGVNLEDEIPWQRGLGVAFPVDSSRWRSQGAPPVKGRDRRGQCTASGLRDTAGLCVATSLDAIEMFT